MRIYRYKYIVIHDQLDIGPANCSLKTCNLKEANASISPASGHLGTRRPLSKCHPARGVFVNDFEAPRYLSLSKGQSYIHQLNFMSPCQLNIA